jgi:8-oxo-dGTP diphosphatase
MIDILRYVRAGVILETNGKYLVVQGRLSGKWSFPKGHREKDEKPIQTAVRELEEETGIILESPENYKNVITFYNGNYVYFYYKLSSLITPLKIKDTNEVRDVKWVDISELKLDKYDKNCTLKLYLKNFENLSQKL